MLYSLIVETWYVCIPVIFMLAVLDPVLTVLSFRRYKKTLAKKVDIEKFELNPRWQKEVEKGNFLPAAFVIRVAVSLVGLLVLFLLPEVFGPDPSPRDAIVGYLLCTFLIIDLNHLSNIRSFALERLQAGPAEAQKKVRLGYSYSLGLTELSYETTFLLLFVLFLLLGGYFLFGAMLAPLVTAVRLRFMRVNALRKEAGLAQRNYRKLRLAMLFIVIAAVVAFLWDHRSAGYYDWHLSRGNAFAETQEYESAGAEYRRALKYDPGGKDAKSGLEHVESILSSSGRAGAQLESLGNSP